MSYVRIRNITLAAAALAILGGGAGLGYELWEEQRDAYRRAVAMTGGDPSRGEEAILRYGCPSCHTIPGVTRARGLVGPPLTGFASRVYVGGVVENTPENLMSWIQNPQGLDDRTAMPNLGVTDADARNIAAFLYTLH